MGGISPRDKVAYLDALATASEDTVFFHVINRHFSKDMEITVDVSALGGSVYVSSYFHYQRITIGATGVAPTSLGRVKSLYH